MKALFIGLLYTILVSSYSFGQSVEVMGGHQRIFVDVQWLKPLDTTFAWSIFSRARATVDYENRSDLFWGVYLNRTSPIGLGGTVIGRIGSNSSGGDLGVHYLKATKNWLFFGLATVGFDTNEELTYAWFSILRFTPKLVKEWRLYTSLELYHAFYREGHLYSTQRLRAGLSIKGWQFGLAYNIALIGQTPLIDHNLGGFIRKEF